MSEQPTEGAWDDNPTVRAFQQIVERSDLVVERMHELQFGKASAKTLERRYSPAEAETMSGQPINAIRQAEAQGMVPAPTKMGLGRKPAYTLESINAIRDHFGTNPGRKSDERPFRLSFQNFKGGCGKSTLCCHFAQYLAQKGYRVLLVDCDSQASATSSFGYLPDHDLEMEDTLMPFITGEQDSLHYAVRSTYWDRLDIIPANLELYGAEYHLAMLAGSEGSSWVNRIHEGLLTIERDYDVLVLDSCPALGMVSLNVARALNGLIVPTPPAMYDYHSTITFFRMMIEVMVSVGKSIEDPLEYDFVKMLVSKYDAGKSAQEFMAQLMNEHYAGYVLDTPLVQSAEIDNASSNWQTVYELTGPSTSHRTYKRCLEAFDNVFGEIEQLIRGTWPSHSDSVRQE